MIHGKLRIGLGTLAAASMMAVGAAGATGSVAGAARPTAHASNTHTVKAAELALARKFLGTMKIGFHAGKVVSGSDISGVSQLSSTNWSGYADVGSAAGFTSVRASWKEPTGTCSGTTTSLAAFWVGIDGISSSDPTVEQDGTIIECVGGTASYFDWWEMYPTNAVQVVASVSPGDHISASVTFSGGKYSLKVTDSTHTTASFSESEACGTTACENMSAEWIAEAPCCSSGTTVYPLTKFTTWRASGDKETYLGVSGGITGPPTTDEIKMVNSANAVKAQPSAVNSTNNAFSVVWKRAS